MDRKLSYRELQSVAKKLKLPGNLKYDLLSQMVEARGSGNEELVQRILSNQKLERAQRRNEKHEARAAAYKHLKISQEKILKVGRKQTMGITACPGPSPALKKPFSVHESYLRSLLALPTKTRRELIKRENENSKNREYEGQMYYNQYLSQQIPHNGQQNFITENYMSKGETSSGIHEYRVYNNGCSHNYLNKLIPCGCAVNSIEFSDVRRPLLPQQYTEQQQSSRYFPELIPLAYGPQPNYQLGIASSSNNSYLPMSQEVVNNSQEVTANMEAWGEPSQDPLSETSYITHDIAQTPNSDTLSAIDMDVGSSLVYGEFSSNCSPKSSVFNNSTYTEQQGSSYFQSQSVLESNSMDQFSGVINRTSDGFIEPFGISSEREQFQMELVNVDIHQDIVRTCDYDQCGFVQSVSSHSYVQLN